MRLNNHVCYRLFNKDKTYNGKKYFIDQKKILKLRSQVYRFYRVKKYEEGRLDIIIQKIYGSVYPYKSYIKTIFAINEFKIKEDDIIPIIPKGILDRI